VLIPLSYFIGLIAITQQIHKQIERKILWIISNKLNLIALNFGMFGSKNKVTEKKV